MTLELRKTSKWWYGRWMVNGRIRLINLGIEAPADGRPERLERIGTPAFERSRAKARTKHDLIGGTIRDARTRDAVIAMLNPATAADESGLKLSDLATAWEQCPSKRSRCPQYASQVRRMLHAFCRHLDHNGVSSISQITADQARRYIRSLSSSLSPRTRNSVLITLRSVFRLLAMHDHIHIANPFASIPLETEQTRHRRPFTQAEIASCLHRLSSDPVLRPIFVCGLATGMRRGDCCFLRWSSVDLAAGFIACASRKTGEPVEIPIFPILARELASAHAARTRPRAPHSPYVWPAAASAYRNAPQSLSRRLCRLFRSFRPKRGQPQTVLLDFHSLRTTWITNALSAGVPIELVRRVTGHTSVEVVLRHYFRPGRAEFSRILSAHMPSWITGAAQPRAAPHPAS